MACNIWAASMIHANQYNLFVISRLFAGMFGSVPSILGASVITDLFFLHQRGRIFLVFSLSFLLGTVAGPTFGGFIVEHVDWPLEFWWTVGLQGLAVVSVFFCLEETGFCRDGVSTYPIKPKSFLANRISTFFPGNQVVPPMSRFELVRQHQLLRPLMNSLTREISFILRPPRSRSAYPQSPFWQVPSSFSHLGGL